MSLISVLQSLNGAQFLNTTGVAALLGVAVIFPVIKIYASEWSQRFYSNELVKNLIGFSCEKLPFDSLSITYHFLLQILNFYCQNHLANLQFFVFPLFMWLWQNFVKN